MIFSVLALFVGHAAAGITDLSTPWPVVLFAVLVQRDFGKPVPAQGFLPARHAVLRGELGFVAVVHQAVGEREDRQEPGGNRQHAAGAVEKVYGSPEAAQVLQYLGYSFRCFNTHGRMMGHPGPPGDGR